MGSFGLAPLGTGLGPFGGPGLITVLGVLPESVNGFVVVFDRAPLTKGSGLYYSAVNERNYLLTPVDPSTPTIDGPQVPVGVQVPTYSPQVASAWPDLTDAQQVHLVAEADLQATVRYVLRVDPHIRGRSGEVFAGPTDWEFLALVPGPVIPPARQREEQYRDLAYATFPRKDGGPTLVYEFDPSMDLAIQGAADSLRKRLYRRLLTGSGGFAFLPGYGAGIQPQALAKNNRLQELADVVVAQVRQEPEVLDAGATVTVRVTDQGTFVSVDLRVQTRAGPTGLTLEARL